MKQKKFSASFIPTLTTHDDSSLYGLIDPDKINVFHAMHSIQPGGFTGLTHLSKRKIPNFTDSGEPYIDLRRRTTREQLTDFRDNGIHVPTWYSGKVTDSIPALLKLGKKYMFKSNGTARSLGKMPVDRELYVRMVQRERALATNDLVDDDEKVGIFNKEFNVPVGHVIAKREMGILYKDMGSNDYIIQEFVDIDKEYRVIYTDAPGKKDADQLIVFYREGCQPGTEQEEDTYRVPVDTIPKTLRRKLLKWLDKHPFPIMSIDIYKDTDGQWGAFEYANEFSMEGEGIVTAIGDRITQAFLRAIHKVNPDIKLLSELVNKRRK